MKYLAILRDSLRETIDSKVFFVTIAISVLAILILATLSFEPNPPDQALQTITSRFSDGAQEVDLPVVGRVKATPSLTRYSVEDIKSPPDTARPWEGEYQFVIESRDLIPTGSRIAVLSHVIEGEEQKEKQHPTGKKTRAQQLQEDLQTEARLISEREKKKGGEGFEVQGRIQEQLLAYLQKRLEDETRSLRPSDLAAFIKDQLENQGNWRVVSVTPIELPADQRIIKLKVRTPVQDGEETRWKVEDKEGEVSKFAVVVASNAGTYRVWPHKATLFFGAIPLGSSTRPGELVYKIAHYLVGIAGAPAIMLLACIITAFFIPNMLNKGTIDLLLAKPIGRVSLLSYKYIGGLTFMFINTAVLIVGLWIVLGIRTGVWELPFLYMIFILTFEFAMFYACSTLAAVLTRSPIVCILVCVMMWGLLMAVGWLYWFNAAYFQASPRAEKAWYNTTIEVSHAILPHYLDLDWLGDKEIEESSKSLSAIESEKLAFKNEMIRWPESIVVTALYILGFLGLACWRFAVRDY